MPPLRLGARPLSRASSWPGPARDEEVESAQQRPRPVLRRSRTDEPRKSVTFSEEPEVNEMVTFSESDVSETAETSQVQPMEAFDAQDLEAGSLAEAPAAPSSILATEAEGLESSVPDEIETQETSETCAGPEFEAVESVEVEPIADTDGMNDMDVTDDSPRPLPGLDSFLLQVAQESLPEDVTEAASALSLVSWEAKADGSSEASTPEFTVVHTMTSLQPPLSQAADAPDAPNWSGGFLPALGKASMACPPLPEGSEESDVHDEVLDS